MALGYSCLKVQNFLAPLHIHFKTQKAYRIKAFATQKRSKVSISLSLRKPKNSKHILLPHPSSGYKH